MTKILVVFKCGIIEIKKKRHYTGIINIFLDRGIIPFFKLINNIFLISGHFGDFTKLIGIKEFGIGVIKFVNKSWLVILIWCQLNFLHHPCSYTYILNAIYSRNSYKRITCNRFC